MLSVPLYEMILHLFEAEVLPPSMREANITLVVKKGKPPEECSSYRPISVLNADFKLLAKVLALELPTCTAFLGSYRYTDTLNFQTVIAVGSKDVYPWP